MTMSAQGMLAVSITSTTTKNSSASSASITRRGPLVMTVGWVPGAMMVLMG